MLFPCNTPDTQTIGPQIEVVAHKFAPLLVPEETIRGPQMEVVAHIAGDTTATGNDEHPVPSNNVAVLVSDVNTPVYCLT